ncbi:hypothetical protein J2Z22_003201 [Paenibacillus forsythiae]|uniref:Uncharacterized protein n=1 Tax=Paenibacillus forsythiae TaxID=365616 RepID=A0ABU3HA02_9BACL|nr:hypothetical protein [Paenibacillus forsythiae]MDT3427638.1 hypothetical protein [Paenibacillus forsythiae]
MPDVFLIGAQAPGGSRLLEIVENIDDQRDDEEINQLNIQQVIQNAEHIEQYYLDGLGLVKDYKLERKYPADGRKNIIEDTELEIDFKVKISGTSAIRNAT